MDQFKEIINTYLLNYPLYENGKIIFECEYGELIFFKNNSEILTLFGIYINPQHRVKGLCRDILYYLIDNTSNKFKYICIESVLSKILYEYLLRFEYKNKHFKLIKTGFIYKI